MSGEQSFKGYQRLDGTFPSVNLLGSYDLSLPTSCAINNFDRYVIGLLDIYGREIRLQITRYMLYSSVDSKGTSEFSKHKRWQKI